jgi:CBS domain-containing protein
MSARAACRLRTLGFTEIYDYVAGKADWMAAGRPTEGALAHTRRITEVMRTDVPRCRPDEVVGAVQERVGEWDVCVVVNERNCVLGLARAEAFGPDRTRSVADVMQEGPPTFRPNLGLAELAGYLRKRGLSRVLVTTSMGTLIGLVRLEDLPPDGGGGAVEG